MTGSPSISFADPAVQKCPFPVYDKLRDEAPVYLDPVTGHYVLTRYSDVRSVAMKFRNFSNNVGLLGIRESEIADEIAAMYDRDGFAPRSQMQSLDPPQHKEKRARVDRAFASWQVEKVEPLIRTLANELIDGFIEKPEADFVTDFAAPLTVSVISHQLGISREGHSLDAYTADVQRYSDLAVEAIDPLLTSERYIEITRELIRMQHVFAANIERVRKLPDDTLLSQFVQTIRSGDEPDVHEILEVMKTMVVAGNETTRFAMASGLWAIAEDPALGEALANNPGKIPIFVEEVLRVRTPTQTLFRRVLEDTELHGITIPKGARIEVRFGAGNLDPNVFECPAEIRLDRPNATAHLAFGVGIHSCIGMALARAELKIGFDAILRRLRGIRLARDDDGAVMNPAYLGFGLSHLYVAFDRNA